MLQHYVNSRDHFPKLEIAQIDFLLPSKREDRDIEKTFDVRIELDSVSKALHRDDQNLSDAQAYGTM